MKIEKWHTEAVERMTKRFTATQAARFKIAYYCERERNGKTHLEAVRIATRKAS